MKKPLAFVALAMGILLISLAVKQSPQPLTMQRSNFVEHQVAAAGQPRPEIVQMDYPPATVTMPEPVVISTWLEAGRIKDQELRTFVRKKADFRQDKVLYFEWLGCSGDTLGSESDAKNKKYTITLHSGTGEQNVTHRQIFIIPVSYSYDVHIGQ